jgi:hypothetical protein
MTSGELVVIGSLFIALLLVGKWSTQGEKKGEIEEQQDDNLGLWIGLGFAFQAIIFFVFLNDLPRGMERLKYIPIISAIASALTNTFIFESGKVGVRTFFAVSSIALAYYALISL